MKTYIALSSIILGLTSCGDLFDNSRGRSFNRSGSDQFAVSLTEEQNMTVITGENKEDKFATTFTHAKMVYYFVKKDCNSCLNDKTTFATLESLPQNCGIVQIVERAMFRDQKVAELENFAPTYAINVLPETLQKRFLVQNFQGVVVIDNEGNVLTSTSSLLADDMKELNKACQ